MSTVKAVYKLARTFDDSMVRATQKLSGTKGIKGVDAMAMTSITVHYDDSRLSSADVERLLLSLGVPVASR